MKSSLTLVFLFVLNLFATEPAPSNNIIPANPVENIFIITIDGFRWQELFNGADESLINNSKYTADTALAKNDVVGSHS